MARKERPDVRDVSTPFLALGFVTAEAVISERGSAMPSHELTALIRRREEIREELRLRGEL